MIEEVTDLSGDASTITLAPTEATATDATATDADESAPAEKPKRQRVTKKVADAELPLEGVEAKPKRATRKKKSDENSTDETPTSENLSGDDEAARAKSKRVTRAKKTEATASQSSEKVDAPEAPATSDVERAAPAINQAPSNVPAVAMGSFTPAFDPAQDKAEVAISSLEREMNRAQTTPETSAQTEDSLRDADNRPQTAPEKSAKPGENGASGEARDNRGESSTESDEDDFRNSRLSYRDRRAMRREQRIVSRSGTDEDNAADGNETRGLRGRDERNNRDNNARDNENRDNSARDNSARDNENRDNSARDNRDSENREVENRGERNNRDNNRNRDRNDRNNRENRNNRGERDNRNGDNRDRNREPRENRRERNGRNREYELSQLEAMDGEALQTVVAELNMEEAPGEKSELILAILEAQAGAQNAILKRGILEILPDQKGFLRTENYYPSEGDVYVSPTQIKRFGLKTGDEVLGTARVPKENERYHGLLRVESINGLTIEASRGRRDFEKLTPIFPTERFNMETEPGNITARIIDLISPIGKGQRGLIVAPPKAGKTTLIKSIANSITENNPEVLLFVLLIDERPEEVTDLSRSVRGEVVASTFDEVPENHIRVSDIVMERAKRLVEMGHDVVVLMDSITRLSRASNLVVSPSGRTMSGGLDPAAMYKPKRHFGAARNIENGGSLTMLATVLVDTGSRMDDYIFEELKGTGNLDLVLDRDLFNQRIFPAIDINRSGTRRDDLLLSKEELAATFHLRRTLAALDNDKAVSLLIDRLKNTKTNADFMEVVAKSQRNAGNGS